MKRAEIKASPRLRAAFFLVAAIMLALWGWSLVPAIHGWNNPNEDGFSFVPVFYATILFLPLSVMMLAGGLVGHGKKVWRARNALIIGLVLLALIVAFEIFAGINNASLG
jgi:hypothetical protein